MWVCALGIAVNDASRVASGRGLEYVGTHLSFVSPSPRAHGNSGAQRPTDPSVVMSPSHSHQDRDAKAPIQRDNRARSLASRGYQSTPFRSRNFQKPLHKLLCNLCHNLCYDLLLCIHPPLPLPQPPPNLCHNYLPYLCYKLLPDILLSLLCNLHPSNFNNLRRDSSRTFSRTSSWISPRISSQTSSWGSSTMKATGWMRFEKESTVPVILFVILTQIPAAVAMPLSAMPLKAGIRYSF